MCDYMYVSIQLKQKCYQSNIKLLLFYLWLLNSLILIQLHYDESQVNLKLQVWHFVGLTDYTESCRKMDEPIPLYGCSKYYLQLDKARFIFDQELDNCSAVYQNIQATRSTLCNHMNNSDICTLNLSEEIQKDQRCFLSNSLLVEYKCEGNALQKYISLIIDNKMIQSSLSVSMQLHMFYKSIDFSYTIIKLLRVLSSYRFLYNQIRLYICQCRTQTCYIDFNVWFLYKKIFFNLQRKLLFHMFYYFTLT